MDGSEKLRGACSQSPADGTDLQLDEKKNPCHGCEYYGGKQQAVRSCNYFLMTGKRRPCDPGEGCTVREDGRMKKRKAMTIRGNSRK